MDSHSDFGPCQCPACQNNREIDDGAAITPATNAPNWDISDITTQLTRSGASWSGQSVTFGFAQSNPGYGSESGGFSVFTNAQRTATREAMEAWDDVIAIDLVEAANGDSAQIRLANTTTGPSHAWAYMPSSYWAEGGDVWINPNSGSNFQLDDGDYGLLTMIHEIGHALGLSHPGDYNGGSPTYANDAVYAQDSRQYTVMSYFGAGNTGADHAPPGDWTQYAATPLLHDIAAIQAVYGADKTTRTGDTVYGFNSNAGRDAFDFTVNTAPVVAIWDAGGNDTLDVSGTGYGQTIDLNEGAFSDVLGMTGNVAIAYGAQIENAIGGSGSDTITGNDVANTLSGNGGADAIHGRRGDDTLDGGNGNDTIEGGDGADTLIGGAGNDHLIGNKHDDVFIAGAGADIHWGGKGTDTVDYSGEAADLNIRMNGSSSTGGAAEGDTFANIENLISGRGNDTIRATHDDNAIDGGYGNDLIYGYNGRDTLEGGAGDDHLIGNAGNDLFLGGDGADVHWGGNGTDTVDHSAETADLAIDVMARVSTGGAAAGDRYENIEIYVGGRGDDTINATNDANEIQGGNGNDWLIGRRGDDTLDGGAGNDILWGGNGDDTLIGGVGDDELFGGGGADTFVFSAGSGSDIIRGGGFNAAEDALVLSGFGFADTQDAWAFARQQGDDLLLDFGDDTITIENMVLGTDITADDLMIA